MEKTGVHSFQVSFTDWALPRPQDCSKWLYTSRLVDLFYFSTILTSFSGKHSVCLALRLFVHLYSTRNALIYAAEWTWATANERNYPSTRAITTSNLGVASTQCSFYDRRLFKENNLAIKKRPSNETVTWHSTMTVSGDGNDRCYVNKTNMSDRGDRERPFDK